MSDSDSIQNKPWFRWVIAGVLGVCGLWICVFTLRSCEFSRPVAQEPDGPLDLQAKEIMAKLQEDPRFRHVSVFRSTEDPTALVVAGEIEFGEDVEALNEKIKELNLPMPVTVKVEPMDETPE